MVSQVLFLILNRSCMHLVWLGDLTESTRLLASLIPVIFQPLYTTKTIRILLRAECRNLHLWSRILIIRKLLIRLHILTILIQISNLLLHPSLMPNYLTADVLINSLMLNKIYSIISVHFTRWCFIAWHVLLSHTLLRIVATSIACL